MRRRALDMVITALVAAVALLGLPLAILWPSYIWKSQQSMLDEQAESLTRIIASADRIDGLDYSALGTWTGRSGNEGTMVEARRGDEVLYRSGPLQGEWVHVATAETPNGVVVTLTRSATPTIGNMAAALGVVALCCTIAFGVGVLIAMRGSRKIAAPLIYLAAQAEQVGAGQVQVRTSPSGIEEIDLVQEELARSSERMAGRIAAERQLASDIAHQLRTPLTALSMRLEEIGFLSDDEQVRTEAEACLDQVERMTRVMEDLRRNASRKKAGTRALHTDEILAQQEEEWGADFREANRQLCLLNDAGDRLPVATPGSLSQALATLIENSLRYGAGTVTVRARKAASSRSIVFEVSDEGAGVDDEIAPDIFTRGISGHGSTGIGLALAKDLVEADGGRIELTQRRPPVFTISLPALPDALDPDRVMPKGAVVALGRRGRRI